MTLDMPPQAPREPWRPYAPPPPVVTDSGPGLAVLVIVAVVALATLSHPLPIGLSLDHPGAVRWIAEGLTIAINAWIS
jgi:hypothetical protein